MALTHEQEKECANLKRLFSERSQMTQKEFAAKFGLGTVPEFLSNLPGRSNPEFMVIIRSHFK